MEGEKRNAELALCFGYLTVSLSGLCTASKLDLFLLNSFGEFVIKYA